MPRKGKPNKVEQPFTKRDFERLLNKAAQPIPEPKQEPAPAEK